MCESTGYCAFDDSSCPSGLKYEANAGGNLAGMCVAVVPPCGGVGEACCAEEGQACNANAYCSAGMCQVCALEVSFGRRYGCIRKHDNTVWCTGDNSVGQGGVGIASTTPSSVYMQVRDSNAKLISDAVSLAAGREHACVARMDGTVWCWGANESGQLGNNVVLPMPPMKQPPSPFAVQVVKANGMPLTGIVRVGNSERASCALDNAGTLWCWGANGNGMLGDGTATTRTTAAQVLDAAGGQPFSGASELQVGRDMACVRKGADIWCWGDDGSGEFGDNTTTHHMNPVEVATTTSFAAGTWYSCRVNPDTTVSCSGWGCKGRLGDGSGPMWDCKDEHVPVAVLTKVGGPPLIGVSKVAAGGWSCALMLDSTLQCWGDDTYGQTGTGGGSTTPMPVRGADGAPITGIESVTGAHAHACARTKRGELLCWGRGTEGEFGDGTFLNRGYPQPLQTGCQ